MDEKGKLVRTADIPVQTGKPTPSDVRKWLKQQVPYKNFAGMSPDLDARATQYVHDRKQQFRARMHAPMRRWSMNWSTANTEALWQEHEDDVHIPETKKALDSKVARIEEAITQFDPVFEADGTKGDMSRTKAKIKGSYTYRLMELAGWRDLVQPLARDAELCNVQAIKISWEHLIENVVEREIELRHEDDRPYYHDERRMRRAVARSGVRYHQVDPFWLLFDIDAPNIQEAAYVGDESLVFIHELEAQAEQGIFPKEQVQKLRDRTTAQSSTRSADDTARAEWTDRLRQARSITLYPDYVSDLHGEHGAKRTRVIELWAWWDFGDGIAGVTDPTGAPLRGTHRVVITVADGIVLRFQLNPFDKKFVPYAVSRINRNGHEMVAPAPFDSVVQMQAHYDRISSNIMRWADLAVSPLVVTSDLNSDLPDTILDVRPGTVMKNVGGFDFIKVPDIGNAVGYFHNYFRREMEETSGALRVFESPQGTATETERKVQEQQRMVRASVRANAELWRQAAQLTDWIAAQFATGPEQFKIMGKAAKIMGQWAVITPDVLQEDVEYRFLALTDLHTFGNQQQGIRQYLNAWGPMLQGMPEINLNAMARIDWELSVGYARSDDVFPAAEPSWEAWPQEEENAMLLAGQRVSVHDSDDDDEHIEKTLALLDRKDLPAYIEDNILEHLNGHVDQKEKKAAQQRAQQQQADQAGKLMQATGGQPGVDQPPLPGGMPAQEQGVTPGPQQDRTVARTGREGAGLSQTQAMAQ